MADITNTKTYFLTQAQYETLRTGGTTEVTDYNGNKKTLTGLPSDGYFVCYYQNIIGPTGPRGFTGAAGEKGPTGPQGALGPTGSTWFSGNDVGTVQGQVSVDPSPAGVKVGDFYFNEEHGEVYRYNESKEWTKIATLKGAQGPKGDIGNVEGASLAEGSYDQKNGLTTKIEYDKESKKILYTNVPVKTMFESVNGVFFTRLDDNLNEIPD